MPRLMQRLRGEGECGSAISSRFCGVVGPLFCSHFRFRGDDELEDDELEDDELEDDELEDDAVPRCRGAAVPPLSLMLSMSIEESWPLMSGSSAAACSVCGSSSAKLSISRVINVR
jgi:hypothetical protein